MSDGDDPMIWLGRTRWSPGYLIRHPALSALLIGLVVAGLGWLAVSSVQDAIAIRDRGVTTAARVVSIHDGKNDSYQLEFVTAGGERVQMRVSVRLSGSSADIGAEQEVIYDPLDPAGRAYQVGSPPSFTPGAIWAGVAILVALLGLVSLGRQWTFWRDNAEAWLTNRHTR